MKINHIHLDLLMDVVEFFFLLIKLIQKLIKLFNCVVKIVKF
jgi:hypothetical protein